MIASTIKRGPAMKRTLISLALLITFFAAGIAIYVISTAGDDPASASDPATTVQKVLDNYAAGRTAALEQSFCDPALAAVILPDDDTPRYTFKNVTIHEQERSGDVALVLLNATISTNPTNATALAWQLELMQRDHEWCISGVSAP